jgi:hypothetical protein
LPVSREIYTPPTRRSFFSAAYHLRQRHRLGSKARRIPFLRRTNDRIAARVRGKIIHHHWRSRYWKNDDSTGTCRHFFSQTADFITSQRFHVTYLRQIFRQGKHSGIVRLAHPIITSDTHAIPDTTAIEGINPERDFHFILANSPEECTQKVERLCTEILPTLYEIDPTNDIQVLAPLRKGSAGIDALNERLQRAISGAGKQIPWCHFRLGDKVIQLRNNYEKKIFTATSGLFPILTAMRGLFRLGSTGRV